MLFMFVNVRAVHIRITNGGKKQNSLSGIFCWILFIPNNFLENRSTNRFVPVIFECVTICDICDQNVTKSVLLKKLKKIQKNKRGHNFEIVTFCYLHKYHKCSHIECDWYKLCFCFCFESGSERLSKSDMHL